MKRLIIDLLEPSDFPQFNDAQSESEPANLDLIEAITGKPNLTHAWNEFALRAEVVEKLSRFQ